MLRKPDKITNPQIRSIFNLAGSFMIEWLSFDIIFGSKGDIDVDLKLEVPWTHILPPCYRGVILLQLRTKTSFSYLQAIERG